MRVGTAPAVALFVFNRPTFTREVVDALRQHAPPLVLLVADGPRDESEVAACDQARSVVLEGIDWPCEIRTELSLQNLGCRRRLASGLEWVFTQVEEAIVLEDDCVPSRSFLPFCAALLERYRRDSRVMHIGGTNPVPDRWRSTASYRFSANTHVWGWATWRRAWKHYDVGMRGWRDFASSGLLRSVTTSRREAAYFESVYDRVVAGEIDTWDYQWQFACWARSGLAVIPRRNLVQNIGFGPDATHTFSPTHRAHAAEELDDLIHPEFVVRDRELDAWAFRQVFADGSMKQRAYNHLWLTMRVARPHGRRG